MTARATERDLRHDADPERFGAAMLKCEGGSDGCSYVGYCLRNGECFASPAHLAAARMIEKLLPADGRAGMHFAYLRQCAEMLRQGRVSI